MISSASLEFGSLFSLDITTKCPATFASSSSKKGKQKELDKVRKTGIAWIKKRKKNETKNSHR